MTVVGSDNFADAPLLAVGTSSAYTPNAGYTTETGEPSAWGGKTAWWKVVPTVSEFHYIDVLYSTGSARAWVYRSFVPTPDLDDLFLVNDPGADTQGGWSAAAGGLYFIRLDSDGSDISYVASVGMTTYDEITERRYLTAPRLDGSAPDVREDYFRPSADVTGPPAAWYYGLFDDLVTGGGPATAEMQVGAWADSVVAEWAAETGDPSWYSDNLDAHPAITYGVASDGLDDIEAPVGYSLADAPLAIQMWATDGPPMFADVDGEVPQVMVDGAFDVLTPTFYLDEFGSPAGDVPVTTVPTEFRFDLPGSPSASDVELYYNDGSLLVLVSPNRVGNPGDTFPVGTWFIGYVAVDFLYQSDDALPYEPPPPPELLTLTYVRQFPTSHPGTWGSSPRIFPPPKVQRIIGGHQ